MPTELPPFSSLQAMRVRANRPYGPDGVGRGEGPGAGLGALGRRCWPRFRLHNRIEFRSAQRVQEIWKPPNC